MNNESKDASFKVLEQLPSEKIVLPDGTVLVIDREIVSQEVYVDNTKQG